MSSSSCSPFSFLLIPSKYIFIKSSVDIFGNCPLIYLLYVFLSFSGGIPENKTKSLKCYKFCMCIVVIPWTFIIRFSPTCLASVSNFVHILLLLLIPAVASSINNVFFLVLNSSKFYNTSNIITIRSYKSSYGNIIFIPFILKSSQSSGKFVRMKNIPFFLYFSSYNFIICLDIVLFPCPLTPTFNVLLIFIYHKKSLFIFRIFRIIILSFPRFYSPHFTIYSLSILLSYCCLG